MIRLYHTRLRDGRNLARRVAKYFQKFRQTGLERLAPCTRVLNPGESSYGLAGAVAGFARIQSGRLP
jgi:hypothetical protein